MNLVEVIPISRGISKETLTYFTSATISPGSLVKIPLRGKLVWGVTTNLQNADEMKSELRASPFTMKKINGGGKGLVFCREFIESARLAADYFAGTTGGVLGNVVPTSILNSLGDLPKLKDHPGKTEPVTAADVRVLQAPDEDRIAHYRNIIRESFARKQSVLCCLPTLHDIKRMTEVLPKGIEHYTFTFHGALSKKEIVHAWKNIHELNHPVLIIGTGTILSAPRSDIGTIIVDRESSTAYKTRTRPYADIRISAEMYAKTLGARIIFGDQLTRIETLHKLESGEYGEFAPPVFRNLSSSRERIIDMRKYRSPLSKEFQIISDEVEQIIGGIKERGERLFIYATRRGLAPTTLCGDCGTIVTCTHCSAPIVLHKGRKGNFFLCHKCGERRSAEETCKKCSSWRLVTLGIGIENIIEAISKRHDLPIFQIDKDTAKTLKQGMLIVDEFYKKPGSILVGTEMALLYLREPIEYTAIISLDSLFSIPDYRINEKVASLASRIRSLSTRDFILQTRYPEQPVLTHAIHGNLMEFYRKEIHERERFEYPPFWTLIKITLVGEKEKVREEMESLEELIPSFPVTIFPAFTETQKGKYVMHGLIRVPHREWPNKKLLESLRALPPKFSVNVDPETLL